MPLLLARGVDKRFTENGVQALDDASLEVRSGEVHAVIGENGAGKTTLMHVIAGVLRPDAGEVCFSGRPIPLGDPVETRVCGIVISYQQPRVDPALTVMENLFLGDEPRRLGVLFDRAAARERVRAVAPEFPDRMLNRRLGQLSSGQVRMVSLIGALLRLPAGRPGILILDEPTEATTPAEADRIVAIMKGAARAGHGVLFISHKLPEISKVADRVTVIRGGRTVATFAGDADLAILAGAMVGEAGVGPSVFAVTNPDDPPSRVTDDPVLELDHVTVRNRDRVLLSEISLTVRRGEIVGLIGIRENGIEAIETLLAGKTAPDSGVLTIEGRRIYGASPVRLRALGVRYVPTDRLLRGASIASSVAENLIALHRRGLRRAGLLHRGRIGEFAGRLRESLGIDAALHVPLWQLSGGTIQKVILSRELEGKPRLLVICEPSWGLDFRSRSRIVERLRSAAASGAAVVIITTDVDEVLEIADRTAVLFDGRIVAEYSRSNASRHLVGKAMAGAVDTSGAEDLAAVAPPGAVAPHPPNPGGPSGGYRAK